jgi:hypothetical protein
MDTYKIELAVDSTEAEEFCAWLAERGHDAKIGRTTGNYVDGKWTSTSTDANEIMERLWSEYCRN